MTKPYADANVISARRVCSIKQTRRDPCSRNLLHLHVVRRCSTIKAANGFAFPGSDSVELESVDASGFGSSSVSVSGANHWNNILTKWLLNFSIERATLLLGEGRQRRLKLEEPSWRQLWATVLLVCACVCVHKRTCVCVCEEWVEGWMGRLADGECGKVASSVECYHRALSQCVQGCVCVGASVCECMSYP